MSRMLLAKFSSPRINLNRTLRWPACITSSHSQLSTFVPIVVEQSGRGDRSYDIYSRLLRSRIICLMGSINDVVSSVIVAQLLFLQAESANKPIHIYINSPGGVVTAGLAIYDTMQYVQPPIVTWCIGQACSMGSLLLAAGTPGLRHTLPNSRIMIHQPSGGAKGQATDILIHAEEIIKLKSQINDLYAKHTGLPLSTIEKFIERDKYMSANEAKELGLVDKVLEAPQKKRGNVLKKNTSSTAQIPNDDLVHPVVEKVCDAPKSEKYTQM